MTWLASSVIGNFTPSSDENEFIGDNVPDESMIHLQLAPSSENTLMYMKVRIYLITGNLKYYFVEATDLSDN